MSAIQNYLNHILSAVYGKDVRQAIHDSIAQCYSDVTTAKTLADDAIDLANETAQNAETRITTAVNTANSAANRADTAALQVTQLSSDFGMKVVNGKICVEVSHNGD